LVDERKGKREKEKKKKKEKKRKNNANAKLKDPNLTSVGTSLLFHNLPRLLQQDQSFALFCIFFPPCSLSQISKPPG
jgi:hypothetical protein